MFYNFSLITSSVRSHWLICRVHSDMLVIFNQTLYLICPKLLIKGVLIQRWSSMIQTYILQFVNKTNKYPKGWSIVHLCAMFIKSLLCDFQGKGLLTNGRVPAIFTPIGKFDQKSWQVFSPTVPSWCSLSCLFSYKGSLKITEMLARQLMKNFWIRRHRHEYGGHSSSPSCL